jgi:hypothetical protein
MKRLITFLLLCILFSCEEEPIEYYEIEITFISPEDGAVFNEGDTIILEAITPCCPSWHPYFMIGFYDGHFELGGAIDNIYPYRYELDTGPLAEGEHTIFVCLVDVYEHASGNDTVTIILIEPTAVTD